MIPAHIRDNNEEQSVQKHLQNVGEFCEVYGSKVSLRSCAKLIGYLHDFGKLTTEFEQYIRFSHSHPDIKIQGPDHSTAGAIWIMDLLNEKSSLIECLTAQLIAVAIMGHHGGLGDIFDTHGESPYLKRLDKPNNEKEYRIQYKEVIKNVEGLIDVKYLQELFRNAVEEVESIIAKVGETSQDISYVCGMLCKYLYSCLIDADRYDTATFMDGEIMNKPQDNFELWCEFSRRLEQKVQKFPIKPDINKLRRSISDACKKSATNGTGIYTLKCPTGSGKTFSALRFALNHAKECHKERIFFIIPFTSIIDQNADEIRKVLSIQENDNLVKNSILELHSAKEADENEDIIELKKSDLVAERMDAPIILTTLVRFLNTFFSAGSRNLRAIHNFANSIIVFDEIQTIPPKFIAMFNGLLNFLSTVCNTTIVLSTATQPMLNNTPNIIKPLLVSKEPELSGCTQNMFKMFKRTEFIDKTEAGGNSKEYVSKLIWENTLDRRNLLAVFNTKSAVSIVYKEIKDKYMDILEEEGFSLYVLTTNLCPAHRRKKIKEIRKKLKENQRVIVLSSQLIEAGVDISFNCVFRSIAGLDSLIQSAGRCNRHSELGYGKYGHVFIINPDFENISLLKDIEKGKEATQTLLNLFERNSEVFSNDLESIEAIEAYFKVYYQKQKDNMTNRFYINNREFLMYDLLASNLKLRNDTIRNLGHNDRRIIISQSFKTAAKNFKAIDNYGKTILVPYQEGKEIIEKLVSASKNSEKVQLLKKAQTYSVNISIDKANKLGNAIIYYDNLGIYILKEGYYDDTFGVLISPLSM